ncbi:DUF2268 domain-containing protein [Bacillus sp. AK128]
MAVVNTKKWLSEYGENPVKLCEQLVQYFSGSSQKEIYENLCLFGMYKPSIFNRKKEVADFIQANHWKNVKLQYASLKAKFKGPDIPIFIFPINQRNSRMMEANKGKSGLAFFDKLFLFLSPTTDTEEIKALLTHEYHHVCRLNDFYHNDEELRLIDTIILEGLAEHAVKEECGEKYNAYWTELYKPEQLEKWYKELILPNRNIKKSDHRFQEILYGSNGYPHMLGYSVGYFVVNQLVSEGKYSLQLVEKLTSKKICKLLPF